MNIAQSVIVITAAGSPMGKAISLHFASLGAKLALVDVEADRLQQTQQACLAAGGNSHPFLLECQDEVSISNLIDRVHHRFGTIDVLINYWFGSDLPTLFSPSSVDQFCRSMSEGATPFFIFGKQAANYMRVHHCEGVIVNLAANLINTHQPINNGSKAMISGLTQSWAKELAEFNIRVGGVVPLSFAHEDDHPPLGNLLSQPLQYEIVRSAEYIVANDYFNGRMIEAEVG
ncbi:short-chain dehydrogenase [Photobacterium proteolyticum]|uniref:Short-chain dehydrogenase n=1 Tax=Photobacterium proteolyticum TaxID=1903952 RepID=A0A1Q9G666_9GAMM|nr:SDR family oxidoreductase [Photobacterium proteolyticum]OLQ69423.1 short-chain dehydrogenase [Photobacterium proteolyticum]